MTAKFYALGTSEADAMVDCVTGKYVARPFCGNRQDLSYDLDRLKATDADLVNLRIYVIKIGG